MISVKSRIDKDLQLLPLRMILSKMATKSEMTWSTSSSPARTVMTSELGFVYFLLRMLVKKTLNVCETRLANMPRILTTGFLHLVHKNPPGRPQLLPREWHGQRNVEFGSSNCISCLSLFYGILSVSRLTCRSIVSSGLKLSRIACSWIRSGGSKKSSLQKPSEGSASSAAYQVYVSNIT